MLFYVGWSVKNGSLASISVFTKLIVKFKSKDDERLKFKDDFH